LSDDVHEFIYDKLEIDAHTIWEMHREEYEKPKWIDQEKTMKIALEESSKSSFNITEPQVPLPKQGEGQKVKNLSLCRDRSDWCRQRHHHLLDGQEGKEENNQGRKD
jgi:hypothetical protein